MAAKIDSRSQPAPEEEGADTGSSALKALKRN